MHRFVLVALGFGLVVAAGCGKAQVDLYDNGTQGDAAANDGIWSVRLEVPPTATAGAHTLEVLAYDVHGDPIADPAAEGDTPQPLSASAQLDVTP